MIEWWQALLISLASGVTAGLLTGGAALLVQRRQQGHDLAMQNQRLEAQRQSEQDEAIRAARRISLQPVFELMAELESGYAHRRWKVLIEAAEEEGVLDYTGKGLLPEPLPKDVSLEVAKRMRQIVPAPRADLLVRASVVRSRIDDEGIRDDLLKLAFGLGKGDTDDTAMLAKIAELHARLERYVAGVDSSA
jgi:hypothetical protein